ncbi:MAG: NAD(P)H-dependent oxidoreductase subunit E [Bacteroidales bacterium]|nr:NAD(P)H-dependent oxidoreductase subunit E [Bacteroidales bacterium]MDD4683782.1 NAD(P)H-dependent oxidoreductase subunit E [Bacteroidales bacterium]
MEKKEITICLGSSCFSRGNNKNLEIIQEYIKNKGLEANVNFKGQLCSEKCQEGPVLTIDNTTYKEVTQTKLFEILDKELKKE